MERLREDTVLDVTFGTVPTISAFFGITIRMYHTDHLPAHFHAEYQGDFGTFTLDGEPLAGGIRSPAARRLIREWAAVHREELEENWIRARSHRHLASIEPLP